MGSSRSRFSALVWQYPKFIGYHFRARLRLSALPSARRRFNSELRKTSILLMQGRLLNAWARTPCSLAVPHPSKARRHSIKSSTRFSSLIEHDLF
jgi:hypothetical protein